ncbi:hypothetical protein K435DRAFT_841439 [Dendrothele bispora CBS 962.96]|uniref:Uncharacterized protein n=1 Tax=Dendrothele bispora (strain CBS 962.96) TaxID=1314807 RepID=A0A4S8LMI0_DENBC|nr:hypothetical protein K435DRAFT_841439 [Dendrothele bispora CBS 962.96]
MTEQPFEGDFFGPASVYTEKDFPGFGCMEPQGDELNGQDRDDEVEEEVITPELEQTWEPLRPSATVSNSDNMTVDSSDLDAIRTQQAEDLLRLRSLPADRDDVHIEKFGGRAGEALPDSDTIPPHLRNAFSHYKLGIAGSETNLWAPFSSRMDWEIARWAKTRGVGSTSFSDLLAFEGVVEKLNLSFSSSVELNEIIDSMPAPRPSFSREEVVVQGHVLDLFKRDILECIRALYGNPDHCQYLCFAPERHYADANRVSRLYHDLHTGKWWWSTQKALEADKPGATIIPIIISSDKTQVTLFRNKSAYPVYMTIGNLPKEIRRKPSQQGSTTIGPLKEAGIDGIVMQSGDGVKRRCHPILAVYVGDYPEQMLDTCGYYGESPTCNVPKSELGDYPCNATLRSSSEAVDAVKAVGTEMWASMCLEANIKPVQHPFWEDLPYIDIFRSITPDLLHQLYQGVMKHLIKWITDICGADEIDARVRRLPPNHGMRNFHKGISSLSRVSGMEHRQICSFLLGLVIDVPNISSHQSRKLSQATRALLDFLYIASYPIHSMDTLKSLEESLSQFHEKKEIFIQLNARENFNLPKIHALCHYVRSIELYGTCDNYNTETTERLHIDFAKDAYRASNHKDEYAQMTKWLEHREKVFHHTNYLVWRLENQISESVNHSDPGLPTERFDFPGAKRTLVDMKCFLSQKLTKNPSVYAVAFDRIEGTGERGYGATLFRSALQKFVLQFQNPRLSVRQVQQQFGNVFLPFGSVDVYHKVKFINYDLYGQTTLDAIFAHPRRYNADHQVTQYSHFDTALININGGSNDLRGIFSSTLLKDISNIHKADMRIGRIRIILSLPESKLETLFGLQASPPKHLAYLEWFTKFSTHPDPSSGLHRVKHETNLVAGNSSRAASIVPLEMIRRSVHLIPKWGGSVRADWTFENVLDECSVFYVNVFKDEHTYINLVYQ